MREITVVILLCVLLIFLVYNVGLEVGAARKLQAHPGYETAAAQKQRLYASR